MSVQVAVTIDAVSGDILINNGLFLQAFQTNSADLTVTGSHDTTLAGVISEDTNLNPAGIVKMARARCNSMALIPIAVERPSTTAR